MLWGFSDIKIIYAFAKYSNNLDMFKAENNDFLINVEGISGSWFSSGEKEIQFERKVCDLCFHPKNSSVLNCPHHINPHSTGKTILK